MTIAVEVNTITDGEQWTLAMIILDHLPRVGELIHMAGAKEKEYEYLQVEHVIHRAGTEKLVNLSTALLVSPARIVPEGLR